MFTSKVFLPAPINDIFVAVQALLLALSSLIVGRFGATYAALVNGFLVTVFTPSFAPFGLVFSLVYGLVTDGFLYAFKVRREGRVRTMRSVAALAFSSALTGVSSMYVTTLLGLVPMMPALYAVVLLAGVLNGVLAGYLTMVIWNRCLINYFHRVTA